MRRNPAMPLVDQILLDNLESRYRVCLAKLESIDVERFRTYTESIRIHTFLLAAERDELIKQITDVKLKYPDEESK